MLQSTQKEKKQNAETEFTIRPIQRCVTLAFMKKKQKKKTKRSRVTDRTFQQHVGKIEDCSSSRPSFILFSRGAGSTSTPALRSTVSSVSYHVLSEKQWHTIIISLRGKSSGAVMLLPHPVQSDTLQAMLLRPHLST